VGEEGRAELKGTEYAFKTKQKRKTKLRDFKSSSERPPLIGQFIANFCG
jgi:hypothetical protein